MRRFTRSKRSLFALIGVLVVTLLSVGSAAALDEFGVQTPVDLLGREVDATEPASVRIVVQPPKAIAEGAEIRVDIADETAEVAAVDPYIDHGTVATVFVLDNSAQSVDRYGLNAIKTAAEQAISELPNGSLVEIVTSGGEPTVLSPMTADKQESLASLDGLVAVDGNDRWGALDDAADSLIEVDGLRNVVVMATAPHSGAEPDLLDVRSRFADEAIVVMAVGEEGEVSTGLDRMADLAGGAIIAVSSPDALVAGTVDAAESIANTMWIDARPAEPLEDGVLTSAAVAIDESHLDLTFGAGRVSQGHADLSSLQVQRSSSSGFLTSSAIKWIGALMALVAAGLAAWAIGMVFVRNDGLDDALAAYDGEYRVTEEEEEEDDDGHASALGSSATIQRAVDFTGQMAEKRGWLTSMQALLAQADIPLRPAEAMFLMVVVGILATILGFLLGGPLMGVIMLVLAFIVPPAAIRFMVGRRARKFERALPDMLALVAGTLKAGYSLMQGIDTVADQIDGPMGVELRRVVTETSLGRPLEESLDTVAERMESPDFGWAVMAIRIQREVGGNLAELLLTVADTMTQRERLRREVKSLTAEGRVSAMVLGGLPIGLGIIMYVLNPDYTGMLLTERSGNIALGIAIVVAVAGFFWMKKIIDIDV
jgi:tight adherence protein B